MVINPTSLASPRGFSHGVVTPAGGRTLYIAGQTAADERGEVNRRDFVAEFETALARVLEVVRAAGGQPRHIARMTVYVTDMDAYRSARPRLTSVWKSQMGDHYPAMALVAVNGLVDRGATVEIQADAVLP
jgi:enamine deaminase RidA (YjgF/YER057c/UK114 family)